MEIARTLRRHDQDGWCQIFVLKTSNAIIVVTTCNGCIVYVAYLHFLYMRQSCFVCLGLFYGKCYVTIVIRELSHFSNRYLGKFLWEEIVSNYFYSSKTLVFIFVFGLSLRFRIDCFFEEIYFSSFYIFFFFRVTGFLKFCDLLFFHIY